MIKMKNVRDELLKKIKKWAEVQTGVYSGQQ